MTVGNDNEDRDESISSKDSGNRQRRPADNAQQDDEWRPQPKDGTQRAADQRSVVADQRRQNPDNAALALPQYDNERVAALEVRIMALEDAISNEAAVGHFGKRVAVLEKHLGIIVQQSDQVEPKKKPPHVLV